MFDINSEPNGTVYKALIDIAFETCYRFILVERHQLEFDDNARNVLDLLKPSLVDMEVASEWPGTELLGHCANVYYYETDENAKNILKTYANGLYEWLCPSLPEDLCFLKGLDEEWLTSIAHEKESWFNTLTTDEQQRLRTVGVKFEKV